MSELIDPIDINDELFQAFVVNNLNYKTIQEFWLAYLAQTRGIRPVKRKIPREEISALFKRLEDEEQ